MRSKKVSVIVPNFNHAAYLPMRLESIYNQTYENFEVILLDDSSNDNSLKILEQYIEHPKTSHTVFQSKNSGSPFKQWNKGISLAKGDYIWIAESDDYAELSFLQKQIELHEAIPDISLSFCQSFQINNKNEIIGTWINHTSEFKEISFEQDFIYDGNTFIKDFLAHKNVIPNVSAVVFNREKLDKIMPLEIQPYFRYNGDWFYYIQLICNSKVAFLSEPLNYFRYHPDSVIATASKKENLLQIKNFELAGRKRMKEYLRERNPSNLQEIKRTLEKEDLAIKELLFINYLKNSNLFYGIYLLIKNPGLIFKIMKNRLL